MASRTALQILEELDRVYDQQTEGSITPAAANARKGTLLGHVAVWNTAMKYARQTGRQPDLKGLEPLMEKITPVRKVA